MKEHELAEDKHQSRLITWCRQNRIFIFAIANQQPMSACCETSVIKRILRKLFKLGLEDGMPDLMMPIPSNGFHGLFIEMKASTGKLRDRQIVLLCWLKDRGYKTATCHSFEEAKAEIKSYLNMKEPLLHN